MDKTVITFFLCIQKAIEMLGLVVKRKIALIKKPAIALAINNFVESSN